MNYTIESDVGRKRSLNEDRVMLFQISPAVHLAVLADGMGGHNAGDVASEMTIRYFEQAANEASQAIFQSKQEIQQWLLDNVIELNKTMYDYSLKNEQCSGMGTTLIAAIIIDNELSIAHVGDSRVYTFTDTSCKLITKDHSYVNLLLELGQINEQEAREHPQKNAILKAVGTEATIEPDYYEVTVEPNSYVLICSDGLSNKLSEGELSSVIMFEHPLAEKGKHLIQLANESGGEDNISLILMSFIDEEVSEC